jgi:hypothetical protein
MKNIVQDRRLPVEIWTDYLPHISEEYDDNYYVYGH